MAPWHCTSVSVVQCCLMGVSSLCRLRWNMRASGGHESLIPGTGDGGCLIALLGME